MEELLVRPHSHWPHTTIPLQAGRWLHPSHRIWDCYTDKENSQLHTGSKTQIWIPCSSSVQRRTISQHCHRLGWEESETSSSDTIPISVRTMLNDTMMITNRGPSIIIGPSDSSYFWGLFDSWGVSLMWEGLDREQPSPKDLSWIINGITNDTLFGVTDGS